MTKQIRIELAALAAAFVAGGASIHAEVPASPPAISARPAPDRPQDVNPMKAGEKAPSATLRMPDGTAVELSSLTSGKRSVLIFYRGGWCPYCSAHLGQIAKAEGELVKLGYQVLAISPDRPEQLKASVDKDGYAYQLLSDSDMTLTQAFGLAFRLDDATYEKYRSFGVDLAKASGKEHHLLPVPAVYLIDEKGIIRFAHWDADYTKRLSNDELLVAAREALKP